MSDWNSSTVAWVCVNGHEASFVPMALVWGYSVINLSDPGGSQSLVNMSQFSLWMIRVYWEESQDCPASFFLVSSRVISWALSHFWGVDGDFITFFASVIDSHVQFIDVPSGRLLQPARHKLDWHRSAIYVFILKGLLPWVSTWVTYVFIPDSKLLP